MLIWSAYSPMKFAALIVKIVGSFTIVSLVIMSSSVVALRNTICWFPSYMSFTILPPSFCKDFSEWVTVKIVYKKESNRFPKYLFQASNIFIVVCRIWSAFFLFIFFVCFMNSVSIDLSARQCILTDAIEVCVYIKSRNKIYQLIWSSKFSISMLI